MNSCIFKKYLKYHKSNGSFTWKKTRCNCAVAGKLAGTKKKNGYAVIGLKNKTYLAHRLVWFFENKKWPDYMLDHIDGNPSNNHISNLREADNRQNQNNQKRHRNGNLVGTTFSKSKKWLSQININNKKKYLGTFSTEIEAHEAYLKAALSIKTLKENK